MRLFTSLAAVLLSFAPFTATAQQAAYNHAYVQTKDFEGPFDSPQVKAGLTSGKKYIVVAYFHGCGGLYYNGQVSHKYKPAFDRLAELGYMVFAPDGMAETGRIGACSSGMRGKDEGYTDDLQRGRSRDIDYALSHLPSEPFTNLSRFYVWGQSEGARAVIQHGTYPAFVKSVVATGWACNGGQEIYVNPPTPFLLIHAKGDPEHRKNDGCLARPNGTFYEPDYNQHWVWGDKESRRRIERELAIK